MAKKLLYSIIAFVVLVLGFGGGVAYRLFVEDAPRSDVFASGELSIHFLELGNRYTGDCIYIKCGEIDMLIDAGSTNSSSETIINYINQYVEDNTLEYVVATHGHEDHIGAFYNESDRVGIFEQYKVETIIDFPMTNKDRTANGPVGKYTKARDKEVESGAKHYTALQCYNNENGGQRTYALSNNVELEILYHDYYVTKDSSGENNYSVCLMLHQGDNHYLFTGDLEKKGEDALVKYYNDNHGGLEECLLYKAGHHGSATSSHNDLLNAIKPKYVCICCCAGTSEYTDAKETQFPTQEMIDRIAPYTDKVYVTSMVDNYTDHDNFSQTTIKSMNGNIIFSAIGSIISVECSNNNLLLKETEWFIENRVMPSAWL